MKTFSIMETQHNLSQVLRVVESGLQVGITRRKELVAHIVPVKKTVDQPDLHDGDFQSAICLDALHQAIGS